MSNDNGTTQPRANGVSNRRRLALFTLLLAMTLGGGVAARIAGGALPVDPVGGAASTTGKAADGRVRVQTRVDRTSVLQGGDGVVRLELAIEGIESEEPMDAVRRPTDLVVVLDRSGSMRGRPMEHALASVRQLIDGLGADDRFALITYASHATTAIPLSAARPEARADWHRVLAGTSVGGGTNMASGLDLATAAVASGRSMDRVPRVILVSDGHANEGDSSRAGLLGRASRAIAGEYVLSAVGVGEGFDESLMTALADAGTGNFYYVKRSEELEEIFAAEFASARAQLASALAVEIEPGSGVEVVSAAGYPLERMDDRVGFRPGALFAGQERRMWISFRLPTDGSIAAGDSVPLGRLAVHYVRDGERYSLRLGESPQIAMVEDEGLYLARLDGDAWGQSVVEEELGALRQIVSSALQSEQPAAALEAMRSFQREKGELNDAVQSPAVAGALSSVAEMEAEIVRAEEAKDAAARNRLSKKYNADGYDARRQGAKYSK